MKKLLLALVFLFPVMLLAQVVVAPSQVVQASPIAPSFVSPAFITLIVSIVLSLNVALSALQKIFAQFAKQEPGALQQVSVFVSKIAQYLGSNPQV